MKGRRERKIKNAHDSLIGKPTRQIQAQMERQH
jgi:hypothetical protein